MIPISAILVFTEHLPSKIKIPVLKAQGQTGHIFVRRLPIQASCSKEQYDPLLSDSLGAGMDILHSTSRLLARRTLAFSTTV